MLQVTDTIAVPESEIEERFLRASGPGGQNVNKVETAVQLRFDVETSAALTASVRARLRHLAGRRLTTGGVLVITARSHRTQEANRRDARERLADLIRRAARPVRHRRPTKPSRASKRKRLDAKKHRGRVKALRGAPPGDE